MSYERVKDAILDDSEVVVGTSIASYDLSTLQGAEIGPPQRPRTLEAPFANHVLTNSKVLLTSKVLLSLVQRRVEYGVVGGNDVAI